MYGFRGGRPGGTTIHFGEHLAKALTPRGRAPRSRMSARFGRDARPPTSGVSPIRRDDRTDVRGWLAKGPIRTTVRRPGSRCEFPGILKAFHGHDGCTGRTFPLQSVVLNHELGAGHRP